MLKAMSSGNGNPEMLKQIISLQSSITNNHVEESVDVLIQKLQSQGKKVKIVEDDDGSGGNDFNSKLGMVQDMQIKKELSAKEE